MEVKEKIIILCFGIVIPTYSHLCTQSIIWVKYLLFLWDHKVVCIQMVKEFTKFFIWLIVNFVHGVTSIFYYHIIEKSLRKVIRNERHYCSMDLFYSTGLYVRRLFIMIYQSSPSSSNRMSWCGFRLYGVQNQVSSLTFPLWKVFRPTSHLIFSTWDVNCQIKRLS